MGREVGKVRLRRVEQKKRASQMDFLQCPAERMWSRDVRKDASQSYTLHTSIYPASYPHTIQQKGIPCWQISKYWGWLGVRGAH